MTRQILAVIVAAMLLACTGVAQQTSSTAASQGGVSGRILRISGEPLPKTTVHLFSKTVPVRANAPTLMRESEPNEFIAQSDQDGIYRFDSVPVGQYSLEVKREGFTFQRGRRPILSVTVAANSTVENVDFKLVQTGVIGGTVLDESGEPMQDVFVIAYQQVFGPDGPTLRRTRASRTDDRGQYRLPALQPGTYLVSALPGFQTSSGSDPRVRRLTTKIGYGPVFYYGTRDYTDAVPIRLRPGAIESADFNLSPVHLGSLHGRIVGLSTAAGPRSVPRITVIETGSPEGQAIEVRRRGDDSFEALNILPGKYRAAVSTTLQDARKSTMSGEQVVNVTDGGSGEVVIELNQKSSTVSGKVIVETSQKAKTPALKSLVVALELIRDSGRDELGTRELNLEESGVFSEEIEPGTYRIDVASTGGNWGNYYLKSVRIGTREVMTGFSVGQGEATPNLIVTLADDGGTIYGVAMDAANRREQGLEVRLVPTGDYAQRVDMHSRASTDANGRFVFNGVAPGTYTIVPASVFDNDGDWYSPTEVAAHANESASLTVAASGTYEVQLKSSTVSK